MIKAPNGCPCYCCEKRTVDCHAACEEYREWAKTNEKIKYNRKKQEQLARWRMEK